METEKQTKKKGRPVGATSFTAVTLEELTGLLKENSEIIVGKIWWEKLSKENLKPKEVVQEVKEVVEDKGEVYF